MKKLFTIGLIMLLALSSLVMAGERDPPHAFSGTVSTNGVAAADGLLIVARIDGVDVASTVTIGGTYGMDPNIFYVPDDASGRAGKTIYFFVKDKNDVYQPGPSAIFMNGVVTGSLNIVVTGEFTTTTTPPPERRGGGGGSSYTPPSIEEELCESDSECDEGYFCNEDGDCEETIETVGEVVEETCESDWTCSEWQDCIAGNQKRTCVDDNACDAENLMTTEEQECEILTEQESLDEEEKGKSLFNRITGAVVGGGATSWTALGIVIAALAGAFLFIVAKKKKSGKKKKK